MSRKISLVDSVKKFHGKTGENVNQWFDRYEVILEMTESTADAAKLLPLFLEDAAYTTWSQLSESIKGDFKQIRKEFQRVFGLTKLHAWQNVKELKFFPGESIDVLVEEIKSSLRVLTEDKPNDHLVAAFLLDSLPQKVSELVKIQHGSEMNLYSVVVSAKNLMSSTNDHYRMNEYCNASFRGTKDQSAKKGFNKVDNRIRCFCCKQLGHTRKDCHVTCFNCGRAGHFQRDCFMDSSRTVSGNESAEVAKPDPVTSAKRQ